jgi:hypothetical protein
MTGARTASRRQEKAMARKTELPPPTDLWSGEHLQAWKRMHPGRDEKVADALSGMLIRNKLKFD